MVIDLTGSSSQQALATRDKVSAQKTSGGSNPVTPSAAKPAKQDTVVLSNEAKAINAAKASLANSPDIDSGKVASIKAAIEDGSFNIDSYRVAEKMFGFESSLG